MHIIEKKLEVIKKINHPNLIKYKEHYKEGNQIIQIMEYCGGILIDNSIINTRVDIKEVVNV